MASQIAEKAKRDALEAEHRKWGSGVAQQESELGKLKKLAEEREKRFSFYKDDDVYNDRLKEQIRWGDTMAPLIKKKKKKSKYEYQGPPPPPNRFGIQPGYRWDGIDRSNGFEVKLFQAKKQQEEKHRDYHRWATEDM
jgi:pre-mRNA-splicing factor CWC26